ncbi:hypothetical protein PIB30_097163 [Stylosanthes scabra]|uniref:Reverse transcriptase domain-containing protein n=1 Tax=Stylosanthes scabra TaxID=79078 RepID=A0ABU6UV31_9FABA|nr:hypothetical protein [Stylosanthes scabra]
MDDFRLFLQEQRVYQNQQATQMANLTEILAGLVTQNINNTPTSSQPSSSSTLPSQPLPNPKRSINAISFHEDSLEHEVADDDEEEFLKMLEEIYMKNDVGFEGSKGIIEYGDGKQEDMPRVTNLSIPPSNDLVMSLPSMDDEFDSISEKLSDPGPCMVKDLLFPVDFYVLDMPPDTPERPFHVLLGRPFLKTARFKLDAFEGTFSFESNEICATFTMGDSVEEKLVEHPILWCDLNKTVVVSTLEAKSEKLIERKASQDGVLNATTTMSTHSKENALVSNKNGKKKNMKTNGVAENVSYMEWNHSTNLSVLKGQPLEFHHDHSHNKGADAYLVKDTSKWKSCKYGLFDSYIASSSSNKTTAALNHPTPPKHTTSQSIIAIHHNHHKTVSSLLHLRPPPPSPNHHPNSSNPPRHRASAFRSHHRRRAKPSSIISTKQPPYSLSFFGASAIQHHRTTNHHHHPQRNPNRRHLPHLHHHLRKSFTTIIVVVTLAILGHRHLLRHHYLKPHLRHHCSTCGAAVPLLRP